MIFTQENLGRLAVSSIIAVLGFVALNQACGVIPDVIVWWLVYCVGSGTVLNSGAGESPKTLALLSILPAVIPPMVAGFFVLAQLPVCMSLPGQWTPVILPFFSWFAIFIFCFARAPLGQFVQILIHPDTEAKAKRAISVFQLLIGGVAGCVLALLTLGKG